MTHRVTSKITGKVLYTGDAEECLQHIANLQEDEGYEDEDLEFEAVDPHPVCHHCSGSGEGLHDGSRCSTCRGHGTL